MKFGKTMVKAMHQSDPEWAPFFMNYKFLKKKIKEIKVLRGESVDSDAAAIQRQQGQKSANDIAAGAGEKMFFRALHAELRKTTDFYASLEQEMRMRYARVLEGVRQLREMLTVTEETFDQMLMAACLKLYKDLLMLENYAIMNFCGFSKILKKHDKNTGFKTRDRFMVNIVSQQPFTRYQLVQELIHQSEHLFTEVAQLCRSAQPTKLSLQTEERLFIEAILDMRSQGVTIRTEEEKPSTDAAAAGSDSPRRGTPGQREAEAEDQAAHGQVLFGQAAGERMNGQLSMPSVTSAAVLRTDSPLRRALLAPGRGASAESQSKHELAGSAGGNEVERSNAADLAADSAAGDTRAMSPASGGGVCGVKLDVGAADDSRTGTGRAPDATAASRKRAAEGAVEGGEPSLAQKQKGGA